MTKQNITKLIEFILQLLYIIVLFVCVYEKNIIAFFGWLTGGYWYFMYLIEKRKN